MFTQANNQSLHISTFLIWKFLPDSVKQMESPSLLGVFQADETRLAVCLIRRVMT